MFLMQMQGHPYSKGLIPETPCVAIELWKKSHIFLMNLLETINFLLRGKKKQVNVDTCRDKRKEEKMEGKERLNEADKGKKVNKASLKDSRDLSGKPVLLQQDSGFLFCP